MLDQKPSLPPVNAPVDIRDMAIDDLAPIFHLGEELFTSDRYPFLYRTWDEFEVIGLYNTDAEYCLVAEVDERLAGFVLGTVISKASWTYGYIIWLGVHPDFQKRGVADKLVDKLVEHMIEQGVRYMLVDTDPRNLPAVKFFTRKGFGGIRDHIFLSMNLSKHERYGKLIARERARGQAEKAGRRKSRGLMAADAPAVEADPLIQPLVGAGLERGEVVVRPTSPEEPPARPAGQTRKPSRRGGSRAAPLPPTDSEGH